MRTLAVVVILVISASCGDTDEDDQTKTIPTKPDCSASAVCT